MTADMVIGGLATSGHGVVTRSELLGAGVTKAEIDQRLRTGALLREHRGVYRVGHQAESVEARYMAAVRACGEGAALSGVAAAHLLGLLKGRAPVPEVTAPTNRRVNGVRTRTSRIMAPRDVMMWRGIRVTSVAWTLVDVAAVLADDDLARACHEAEVRYATTPAQVEAVLARRPKSPGAAKLRPILSGDTPVTLSKLEARRPTARRAAAASTAAGRSIGSPSSSTATGTTARATPGSRTAAGSARRVRAATSSGGTRGETSSRSRS